VRERDRAAPLRGQLADDDLSGGGQRHGDQRADDAVERRADDDARLRA